MDWQWTVEDLAGLMVRSAVPTLLASEPAGILPAVLHGIADVAALANGISLLDDQFPTETDLLPPAGTGTRILPSQGSLPRPPSPGFQRRWARPPAVSIYVTSRQGSGLFSTQRIVRNGWIVQACRTPPPLSS